MTILLLALVVWVLSLWFLSRMLKWFLQRLLNTVHLILGILWVEMVERDGTRTVDEFATIKEQVLELAHEQLLRGDAGAGRATV